MYVIIRYQMIRLILKTTETKVHTKAPGHYIARSISEM
jgi:hypothetical protein